MYKWLIKRPFSHSQEHHILHLPPFGFPTLAWRITIDSISAVGSVSQSHMCTYKEQSTNHQISDEMDKNYKTADTQIDFTTHRI